MNSTEHDAFTTAARAEAERVHFPVPATRAPSAIARASAAAFQDGASWARDHLAAEIRKAQADAWQAGVNFALPSAETAHLARHNPYRTQEADRG